MIRQLATLTVLAVLLTACSDDKGGSDGVEPVAWAEKVCKSVEGQAAMLRQSPNLDTTDPAKAKENLLAYLATYAAGLDKLTDGVKDAGTPKVSDGPQVVDKVTKTLRDAKQGVDNAKSNLETATVTDAASFQTARDKVGEDLAALSDLDPTKDLKSNTELNDAFDKAPTCKKLDESP